MAHFIEPSKRIQFVKAREEYLSNVKSKKKAKAEERRLNGKEIALFYRELVAENNSEKSEEVTELQTEEKPVKTRRRNVQTKMKRNDKFEALTKHDEILWFKAAATNDLSKCEELLNRGISINLTDFWGSTALICAAANGSNDIIEFLMENGADWKRKNRACFTASDLARKKGFIEIAEYIESYGNFNQEMDIEIVPTVASSSNFCEHCKQNFENIQAHHCSIVHIVNTLQPPRPGYAYGISSSNVGYQILKETGWKEEHGLGKEGEGRKYPLKTMLKRDRKGLGLDKLRPKITHFEPGDLDAIKAVPKATKRSYFKDLAERKKHEKAIDNKIRRAVSDFDECPF
uniref:G-patch domain-containing protein n=1 Tax=Panagrolaimus sp. PS1159 TaxID=55785 RepID=A0AC35EQU6_9BILA